MHALGLDERRLGGIGTARFYEVAQQAHAFPFVWRGRRCVERLTEAAGPVASGHGRELFSEQPRALRRLLDRRNRRGDQPTGRNAGDSLISRVPVTGTMPLAMR
jgi:hypothetical protein